MQIFHQCVFLHPNGANFYILMRTTHWSRDTYFSTQQDAALRMFRYILTPTRVNKCINQGNKWCKFLEGNYAQIMFLKPASRSEF